MSRIAKQPVAIPTGVEIQLEGSRIVVKGSGGELSLTIHHTVVVARDNDCLTFAPQRAASSWAMAGTTRVLVNNMIIGVTQGFKKQLRLSGVGYRAKVAGKVLHLTIGYSHPVEFSLPEDVVAETPSQTDIVLKSIDKQKVGQVAAEIRAFRPPEPYKGKGISYADERIRRKEAKKK